MKITKQRILLLALAVQFFAILYLKECKNNGSISSSNKSSSVRIGGMSSVARPILASVLDGSSRTSPERTSSGLGREITSKTEVKINVPQEGSIQILPKHDKDKIEDLVLIKVKDKGLCWHVGGKAVYPVYLGVDFKYAYYKNYGLEVGTGYFFDSKHIDLDLGGSYRLNEVLPVYNLEVYVGYALVRKSPLLGFRINF